MGFKDYFAGYADRSMGQSLGRRMGQSSSQIPMGPSHASFDSVLASSGLRLCLSIALLLSFPLGAIASPGLRSTLSGKLLDRLELPQQRVIGDLGTDFLSPLGLKSSFYSDTTEPAPGRRVRLWNVTPGFSGSEAPFTERDYSLALGAEAFVIAPDGEHQTRWFSVLPGSATEPKQNEFRYEIFDATGAVLETGEFAVAIALNPVPVKTTYRFGPDYRHRDFPFDGYGYGHSYGQGRYGHYWNERRLFKQRQRILFRNSEVYRRRVTPR